MSDNIKRCSFCGVSIDVVPHAIENIEKNKIVCSHCLTWFKNILEKDDDNENTVIFIR